jgi:phosphoribosylformimino-5-aminoimidazole carboxamide ribotide isomerase
VCRLSPVELFPAIDLLEGVAVRLAQGDFARRRCFGDPLQLAERYAAGGARWVHVVDLDAARTGLPVNRAQVLAIAGTTGLQVQAAGGVRSAADAEELLGAGVARLVLGTAALGDPGLVEELAQRFPGRVVVGLDHRGGGRDVAVAGWQRSSGLGLPEVLARLAQVPLAAVVVTAIERDGMAAGPDLDGLAEVLARSAHPVLASGGVRSPQDLRALAGLEAGGRRLAGAVVGRALVEGAMSVQEAMAACAASG